MNQRHRSLTPACPFPFLVNLLKFLGSLRGDADLVGHVDAEAVIDWAIIRLNQLTGIHPVDFLATIARLIVDDSLDGYHLDGDLGVYGVVMRPDLSHVGKALRELDREDAVLPLWRELCRRWPLFGKVWCSMRAGSKPPGRSPELPTSDQRPAVYLDSWAHILVAIGRKNTKQERRRIQALNTRYDGPIKLPGRGGQPKVNKAKLLDWWNDLERRWEAAEETKRNMAATVQGRHPYGKAEEVVPEISGHVKNRRRQA